MLSKELIQRIAVGFFEQNNKDKKQKFHQIFFSHILSKKKKAGTNTADAYETTIIYRSSYYWLVCQQTFSYTVMCKVCLTASNRVFNADEKNVPGKLNKAGKPKTSLAKYSTEFNDFAVQT